MDWSGVDYLWIILMFLSAVCILTAPIHCRGLIDEQVMKFLQNCSDDCAQVCSVKARQQYRIKKH